MSVLADRTIRELCTRPSHALWTQNPDKQGRMFRAAWAGISHSQEDLDALVARGHAAVMTDKILEELEWVPMITPFVPESIKKLDNEEACASYGTSSFGYDLRAAPEFKVFRGMTSDGRIDYKAIDDSMFETVQADSIWIPPNGFILTRSIEKVNIPKDVLALCIGKSTIARVGINCLCTPLEPEWEGYVTLEFSNTTNLPNRFYANEGVLQLIFLRGNRTPDVTYKSRNNGTGGKYMGQGSEIILPRV